MLDVGGPGIQNDRITVDVATFEDTIVEGIETFMLSLTHDTVPFSVTLGITTLTVEIIDDESRFLSYII